MKFFDYCATQYACVNYQMQLDNAQEKFDLNKQAKTKATQELIETQRKFYKFVAKWYFVFNFLYCSATNQWPQLPVIPKKEDKPADAPTLQVVPSEEARN